MYIHVCTSTTYIQKLFHFCSVLSLAPSDEHQFALKVPQFIQTVTLLGKLLVSPLQLEVDNVMNTVHSLSLLTSNSIATIAKNVFHLAKGGHLNWPLGVLHRLVPLQCLVTAILYVDEHPAK